MAAAARVLRIGLWLVACVALQTQAARLDSSAIGAVGLSEPLGAASMAQARQLPLKPLRVGRADRYRDLQTVAELVDSIDVYDPASLGNFRDLLENLESLRTWVLEIGTSREPRFRERVRQILRDIRTKTEFLNRITSGAEVGDIVAPPSRRDNICTDIDTYNTVDPHFVEELKHLCKALDAVHAVVLAGAEEDAAVFEVSGWLSSIRLAKDYANPHISFRVASLLTEEWQWVTNHLTRRLAAPGEKGASKDIHAIEGGLSTWLTDVEASPPNDPDIWENRMKTVYEILYSVPLGRDLRLGDVRTHLQRLSLCKDMIAEYITASDPEFRERIRTALRLMKEKSDALEALAAEREAAGDVDEVGELMLFQRNNICRNIEAYDLEEEWRQDIKHVCESLDKIRKTAMASEDTDAILMEVVGRMHVMRNKPGYIRMPFVGEIEIVFAEEYRWLASCDPEGMR